MTSQVATEGHSFDARKLSDTDLLLWAEGFFGMSEEQKKEFQLKAFSKYIEIYQPTEPRSEEEGAEMMRRLKAVGPVTEWSDAHDKALAQFMEEFPLKKLPGPTQKDIQNIEEDIKRLAQTIRDSLTRSYDNGTLPKPLPEKVVEPDRSRPGPWPMPVAEPAVSKPQAAKPKEIEKSFGISALTSSPEMRLVMTYFDALLINHDDFSVDLLHDRVMQLPRDAYLAGARLWHQQRTN